MVAGEISVFNMQGQHLVSDVYKLLAKSKIYYLDCLVIFQHCLDINVEQLRLELFYALLGNLVNIVERVG